MERIQAPRGTSDVLPEDAERRLRLLRLCEETLGRAGYGPIETPAFESTELFARGVGETTDIVEKEMFTFDDQGGRSLSLRPEGRSEEHTSELQSPCNLVCRLLLEKKKKKKHKEQID